LAIIDGGNNEITATVGFFCNFCKQMSTDPINTEISFSSRFKSVVPDIVVISVLVIIRLSLISVSPFERPIDFTDKDLQHPHYPDWIPAYVNYIISLGIPALASAIITRSRSLTFQFCLSLASGFWLTEVLTEV
jgi:hypothetical protein